MTVEQTTHNQVHVGAVIGFALSLVGLVLAITNTPGAVFVGVAGIIVAASTQVRGLVINRVFGLLGLLLGIITVFIAYS